MDVILFQYDGNNNKWREIRTIQCSDEYVEKVLEEHKKTKHAEWEYRFVIPIKETIIFTVNPFLFDENEQPPKRN